MASASHAATRQPSDDYLRRRVSYPSSADRGSAERLPTDERRPGEQHQGVDIGREHRGPCAGPLAAPTGCRGDRGGAVARAASGWPGCRRSRGGQGGHPADGARRGDTGGVHRHGRRVHGGRGRQRAGDLPRGGRRRRRVHLGDRGPARRLRPGALRRHPRRCRVRLRRPDRRACPGRRRHRRHLREWRPATLRAGDRRRRAALGAAGDGLRAARAVRPSPRPGARLLHGAQRVRAGPLAARLPGGRPVGRAAARPRRHPGDRHAVLPRTRLRHRPPRRRGPEAVLREQMAGFGGRPSASSRTWTTPRTSTSTRSPRW